MLQHALAGGGAGQDDPRVLQPQDADAIDDPAALVEDQARQLAVVFLADVVGGLRSGLTYAGSKTIKELQRKLNYVVITSSGWRESMPHKLF